MTDTQSHAADANIARQERFWTRRASSWDHGAGNNPGLVKVVERVLAEAAVNPDSTVVDLGCGSGQLSLRIAPNVRNVIAIDVSPAMIDLLDANASSAGITNVDGRAVPIEKLDFTKGAINAVVSNYALHHLHDSDKAAAVSAAYSWLSPGGRLVIGDMMFGRGGEARDRQIISSKAILMIKRGPAGWWRIVKNAGRFIFRFQERPVSMAAWIAMLESAGFTDVQAFPVVSEAAVVRGTKQN